MCNYVVLCCALTIGYIHCTPVHAVAVPALIALNMVTMITVLSILAIKLTCYLLKKYKIIIS